MSRKAEIFPFATDRGILQIPDNVNWKERGKVYQCVWK